MKSEVIYSKKFLGRVIEFFFAYAWIWSSLRLLVIGRAKISSYGEMLVAFSPDLIMIFILFISAKILIKEKVKLLLNSIEKLFLIFFATNILLGFILGYDAGLGLEIRGFRITYWPMIFFFVAKVYQNNEDEFEKLLGNIFRWFVFFALAGLIMYFFINGFTEKMMTLAGYPEKMCYFIQRMSPFVWTPVLFGLLMAFAAIYYCYKIFTTNKIIYYVFIAILWGSILLSVSRGAIISFLIAFISMALFMKAYKKSIYILGVLILLYFVVSIVFSLKENFVTWIYSSTTNTLSFHNGVTRVEQWKLSIQNFLDRPWGYGFGKAGFIAHWYYNELTVPSASNITDGWYLKLACETGIYGLISYFTFSIFYFFKMVLQYNTIKILAIGFFILVNAMNVVSNSIDYFPFVSLFWLIIGYTANSFQMLSTPKVS